MRNQVPWSAQVRTSQGPGGWQNQTLKAEAEDDPYLKESTQLLKHFPGRLCKAFC